MCDKCNNGRKFVTCHLNTFNMISKHVSHIEDEFNSTILLNFKQVNLLLWIEKLLQPLAGLFRQSNLRKEFKEQKRSNFYKVTVLGLKWGNKMIYFKVIFVKRHDSSFYHVKYKWYISDEKQSWYKCH